jgi:hypothetical protein
MSKLTDVMTNGIHSNRLGSLHVNPLYCINIGVDTVASVQCICELSIQEATTTSKEECIIEGQQRLFPLSCTLTTLLTIGNMQRIVVILLTAFFVLSSAFTAPVGRVPKSGIYRYDADRESTRFQLADEGSLPEEQVAESKPPVKCPDCNLCDGSGRIPGGIGAVLPWIPIKAYRPCPNFIERGGTYTRTGQALDEIAFGRGSIDGGK